ncbi:MAG: flagellin [Lachnospiraceae bacterium]|nr:flagellin [Lachnospiraceae bacterium]
MRINYNETAILANNALNKTDKSLSASIQRLSSGLKINAAKDNPAGLAISNRMDAQIRGLSVAKNNTSDGISVVETADGALGEISSILQRMSQLAVQAGDDVKTDEDRELIDKEIQQLKEEIERIAKDTEFNGQPLLDGSFDLKGYTDSDLVKVGTYSDTVPVGKYTITYPITVNDGVVDPSCIAADPALSALTGLKLSYEEDDDLNGTLSIKADGDFSMRIDSKAGASGDVELDITGIGAMKIQIGANESQELALRIPTISLKEMGIDTLSMKTVESAQNGIEQIKGALSYINEARSRLGAYQNRLENNNSSVELSSENMTASYSRIMDVDMAEEMTEYSTYQVLSQSGISMLSQANSQPESILQLLQ